MLRTCKECTHFLGFGDWSLCCTEKADLCYENTVSCEKFVQKGSLTNEGNVEDDK